MSDELEKALKYLGEFAYHISKEKHLIELRGLEEDAPIFSCREYPMKPRISMRLIGDFINARQEQVKQLKEKLEEYENPTSMNKRIAKSYADLYNENEQQAEQITALEAEVKRLKRKGGNHSFYRDEHNKEA